MTSKVFLVYICMFVWDPIIRRRIGIQWNGLTHTIFLCLSHTRTGMSNVIYRGLFCAQCYGRRVGCFVPNAMGGELVVLCPMLWAESWLFVLLILEEFLTIIIKSFFHFNLLLFHHFIVLTIITVVLSSVFLVMSLVEQELVTLPEHLSTPQFLVGFVLLDL